MKGMMIAAALSAPFITPIAVVRMDVVYSSGVYAVVTFFKILVNIEYTPRIT